MSSPLAIRWNRHPLEGPLPLDPADRGLLLGDGVFETLPVFNGIPVWWPAHRQRLLAGAALLGIAAEAAVLDAEVAALLAGQRHGILRVTLTRGPGGRGLAASGGAPSLLLTLAPWDPALIAAPLHWRPSSVQRNAGSPASAIKCVSYIDSILAQREAAAHGAEDALMRNAAGRCASFAIGNLLLRVKGRLLTPPASEGALPGIVRARLIALHGVVEAPVSPAMLETAEAVGLTNSLRLVRGEGFADLREALCADIKGLTGIDPREARD